jgi:hypothetical protein
VVYSLFSYHQKNLGGPGSSRGTLEHIRAGLTSDRVSRYTSSLVPGNEKKFRSETFCKHELATAAYRH